MKVTINGKRREVSSENVADLLDELDINPLGMHVLVNGIRTRWTERKDAAVREGDSIEILRVIAGG